MYILKLFARGNLSTQMYTDRRTHTIHDSLQQQMDNVRRTHMCR